VRFLKFNWLYFLISGFLLLLSVFSLFKWGLLLSVDFKGGNLWEISFEEEVSQEEWGSYTQEKEEITEVNRLSNGSWLIKSAHTDLETKNSWETEIEEKFGGFKELRFESLAPSLGKDLLTKTLISIGLAVLGILFYISIRFKNRSFGICAILAMLHDSVILLGSFSLLGHFQGLEIDSLFVTAFLTILAFSVHDTVVVFDGIREISKNHSKVSFEEVANAAIAQTLVRSINNSMTIIFVLLALFLLGGQSTKDFSLALLIGTVLGTYSSTFVAVPLLLVWSRVFRRS